METSPGPPTEPSEVLEGSNSVLEWFLVSFRPPLARVVCVIGLCGNSLSLLVLYKQGLKKPSNILLFSLAIGDLGCLLLNEYLLQDILRPFTIHRESSDISGQLKHLPGPGYTNDSELFQTSSSPTNYSKSSGLSVWSRCMFNVFTAIVLPAIKDSSRHASWTVTVAISVERFIAVFWPLKFKVIVTTRRTWTCVVCLFCLSFGVTCFIKFSIAPDFLASCIDPFNHTVDYTNYYSFSTLVPFLFGFTPVILVLVFSILTGTQVFLTQKKRIQMGVDSQKSSSLQTTKTLLAVCVLYVITVCLKAYILLIKNLHRKDPKLVNFPPKDAYKAIEMFSYVGFNLNSAVNFLIYIVMNKNFRKTLKSIFDFKGKKSGMCACGQ